MSEMSNHIKQTKLVYILLAFNVQLKNMYYGVYSTTSSTIHATTTTTTTNLT